jgi:hypothetical protein
MVSASIRFIRPFSSSGALRSDFQGQGAFDCSPLSAQGIDGLCARLDAAARDDG